MAAEKLGTAMFIPEMPLPFAAFLIIPVTAIPFEDSEATSVVSAVL